MITPMSLNVTLRPYDIVRVLTPAQRKSYDGVTYNSSYAEFLKKRNYLFTIKSCPETISGRIVTTLMKSDGKAILLDQCEISELVYRAWSHEDQILWMAQE